MIPKGSRVLAMVLRVALMMKIVEMSRRMAMTWVNTVMKRFFCSL